GSIRPGPNYMRILISNLSAVRADCERNKKISLDSRKIGGRSRRKECAKSGSVIPVSHRLFTGSSSLFELAFVRRYLIFPIWDQRRLNRIGRLPSSGRQQCEPNGITKRATHCRNISRSSLLP